MSLRDTINYEKAKLGEAGAQGRQAGLQNKRLHFHGRRPDLLLSFHLQGGRFYTRNRRLFICGSKAIFQWLVYPPRFCRAHPCAPAWKTQFPKVFSEQSSLSMLRMAEKKSN